MLTEKQQSVIKFALKVLKEDQHSVFHADPKTKVCVAIRSTNRSDGSPKLTVGIARCNADEPFIAPIGKAIALFRARGKRVPEELMKF